VHTTACSAKIRERNSNLINFETSDTNPIQIHATGETPGFIPAPGDKGKPITVIGTKSIRAGFDATFLQQALNSRGLPGIIPSPGRERELVYAAHQTPLL
jgi:hypothetical protein